MKITIKQVQDSVERVEGIDMPPFSTGICMGCQKQTHGYFGGQTKAGLWVCHPCKFADTKAVKK
jgi:hypothetical protein